MSLRIILLVLDGFPLRHCTPEIAPNITRMTGEGVSAPDGGRAVLPSSTYPNHASLVTGRDPTDHGIFANSTLTTFGIKPAREVGARGDTFLDAARKCGLRTAVAVGDPNIVGVVGAARCHIHWPAGGHLAPETPTLRGFAANTVVFRSFVQMLDDDADIVLCQLDNTDGIAHLHGPDSPEAKAAYSAADGLVGQLEERLRQDGRWDQTILAVVSDHGQISVDVSAPAIDIPGALRRAHLEAEVIEEGSGALIWAQDTEAAGVVISSLDGVAGVQSFAPGILYAHARLG
jgi:predicted AlkP superfamily pyrophosphatase or phosphodiesterase